MKNLPNNDRKVVRGGSWIFDQVNARAGYRFFYRPNFRGGGLGFRILEELNNDKKMIRGGCWSFDADASRSAYRLRWPRPADRNRYVGFRLLEELSRFSNIGDNEK